MGGLGEFFGFDGRINRLGLVWRSVVVGTGIAALAAIAAIALVTLGPGGVGDFETWTQRLTLAVILLSLWAGFGLATRRLRDMGIEPVYVAPAFAALWVADRELLQPLARLEPQSFGPIEAAWMALQVVFALTLLAWPSRALVDIRQAVFAGQPTAHLNWRESS